MVLPRTRDSNFSNAGGGTRKRLFGGSLIVNDLQAPFQVSKNHINDQTGPWKFGASIIDKDVDIQHVDRKIQPINGRQDISPTDYREYRNWFPSYLTGLSPSHIIDNLPSNGEIATAVLASSNPARPVTSLPNFIYELKDLPGMIRDIGHIKLIGQRAFSKAHWNGGAPATPRDAANLQLSYQMGWSPLIGDIKNLLHFQADVDRRVKDLHNLYENGGLHRSVGKASPKTATRKARQDRWSFSQRVDSTVTVESVLGVGLTMRESKYTYARKWGTTRWLPDYPSDRHTNTELRRTAMRLVSGINPNPKIIWDAIPWTWMIDWFTNIGDFLQSSAYSIQCRPSTPCVMYERITEYQYTRQSAPSWVNWGDGSIKLIDRQRRSASATLSASLPFLSARQLSILGALAVQRLR